MLIRLNLLRKHPRASFKWIQDTIEINTNWSTWITHHQRYCSDIKRNEELLFSNHGVGVVIPSPLKIKQTIKTGFHEFIDGPTSIQTSCPICPSTIETNPTVSAGKTNETSKTQEKCLFINKTTGNCLSKC